MPPSSLAIIGTAGRGTDKNILTSSHYSRMVNAAVTLITHLHMDPKTMKVVSGGAAWADHIAVTLAHLGVIPYENLILYLPCSISEEIGFFGVGGDVESKTASTANYYHRLFSQITGNNSIEQILEARNRGATLHIGNGNFFQRNAQVADFISPDGALLAFTFGSDECHQGPWTVRPWDATTSSEQAGLKDGGTAHTWNKARCQKWHAKIGLDGGNDLYI